MSSAHPEQPIDPPEPSAREIDEGDAERTARREEYMDDWSDGGADVRAWLLDDPDACAEIVILAIRTCATDGIEARALWRLRDDYIAYRLESES